MLFFFKVWTDDGNQKLQDSCELMKFILFSNICDVAMTTSKWEMLEAEEEEEDEKDKADDGLEEGAGEDIDGV